MISVRTIIDVQQDISINSGELLKPYQSVIVTVKQFFLRGSIDELCINFL